MNHWILTYEHGLGCECSNSEEWELNTVSHVPSQRLRPKGGLSLCEGGCRSVRAGDVRVLNIGGMVIGRGIPKFYTQKKTCYSSARSSVVG
jgi:hypothetical protein